MTNNIVIDDDMYDEAVSLVMNTRKTSVSFLQRKLRIGYYRAFHLIDLMEQQKLIGPMYGSKLRKIYNNKH